MGIESHEQVGLAIEIAIPGLPGQPPGFASRARVVAPGIHLAVAAAVLFFGDDVARLVEPTRDLGAARALGRVAGSPGFYPARHALAKVHDEIGCAVAAAVFFSSQNEPRGVVENPDVGGPVGIAVALTAPMNAVGVEEHRVEVPIAVRVLFDAQGNRLALAGSTRSPRRIGCIVDIVDIVDDAVELAPGVAVLAAPNSPALFVFDDVLGLPVPIRIGFGPSNLAFTVLGNLFEASVSVSIHGLPGDPVLGARASRGALRDWRARRGLGVVAHEVDLAVAVGIELFPGGRTAFAQRNGLIEVAVARGVPALLHRKVGDKEQQGVEAPVAVAVDFLSRSRSPLEARDDVVDLIGSGIAFFAHQNPGLEALAQVKPSVARGVEFGLPGCAVGVEFAPRVHAAVEVAVFLVARGLAGLEMYPGVDPVVAVTVFFQSLDNPLGVGDAPGIGHAIAPGVGFDENRLGAARAEAEPAIHPSIGVGILFPPGQLSPLVVKHPGFHPAILVAVAFHPLQVSAPVEFHAVGSAQSGGVHAPLLDHAFGKIRFALEASVGVGVQGLEHDQLLGVEAVAGVGLAVGVAVFELFVFAALAVDDAGIEQAVAGGVGLLFGDSVGDSVSVGISVGAGIGVGVSAGVGIGDRGVVERDAFGPAVGVGVAFVANPSPLGIVAGDVVVPAGVAVDGLAFDATVGQKPHHDFAEAIAVGVEMPSALAAALETRHAFETSVAVAIHFAPGDGWAAGLGVAGGVRRVDDHYIRAAVAPGVLLHAFAYALAVKDGNLEVAVAVFVLVLGALVSFGVELCPGIDLAVVVPILLDTSGHAGLKARKAVGLSIEVAVLCLARGPAFDVVNHDIGLAIGVAIFAALGGVRARDLGPGIGLAIAGAIAFFADQGASLVVAEPAVHAAVVIAVLRSAFGQSRRVVDHLVDLAIAVAVGALFADLFLGIEEQVDLGAGQGAFRGRLGFGWGLGFGLGLDWVLALGGRSEFCAGGRRK